MNTLAIDAAEVALFDALTSAICDAATVLINAGLTHSQAETVLREQLSQDEITDTIHDSVWIVPVRAPLNRK
jgi:hypothetical protein